MLHFWICGSHGAANEYNPITLLRDPVAQDIIQQLNGGPATAVRLSAAVGEAETRVLGLLSALVRTGAIVGKGEIYQLAFPVFTVADRQVIWPIANKVGAEIAHHLTESRPVLVETVSKLSSAQYTAIDQLLLAVVGCLALDWGGLERLERLGYLVRHKAQPGNGDYILIGVEPGDDVNERFCYSHSYSVGGYTFTTFGDITGTRNAFPDLLWRLEQIVGDSMPSTWNSSLQPALRPYLDDLLQDAAHLLETLAKAPRTEETLGQAAGATQEKVAALFPLLVQLGYLRERTAGWRPAVPVFLALDRTLVETAAALVGDVTQSVVTTHYNGLQQALQNISPAHNRMSFSEVFTEVWHFIFAETNRILAETGFMASPACTGVGSARFAAWLSCPGSI